MFGNFFNKPKRAENPIRETLFGDMPLDKWPSAGSAEEFPWSAFAAARRSVAALDTASAVQQWTQILATTNLEPRHYAQAWHFLRQHGRQPPPDVAKNVFGAVVEVGMAKGLDLLAAYPDHSARYYNFSGAGVVWEHPDSSLDSLIDALLAASARVVKQIGPWDGERPPAPPIGQMRISFLTPSGLHFGQAPIQALASDPIGGQVVKLATALMQGLIRKTDKQPN